MTGIAAAPAIIELAGVEKTYRSGRVAFRALSGVDLSIAAGEMVAITGPSGSGKTTIINLIAGIDRPTAGTVTVHGSRLDQMTEEQLAVWRGHTIGIVFQFFQLMPTLTAVENTTLPLDLARVGTASRLEDCLRHRAPFRTLLGARHSPAVRREPLLGRAVHHARGRPWVDAEVVPVDEEDEVR